MTSQKKSSAEMMASFASQKKSSSRNLSMFSKTTKDIFPKRPYSSGIHELRFPTNTKGLKAVLASEHVKMFAFWKRDDQLVYVSQTLHKDFLDHFLQIGKGALRMNTLRPIFWTNLDNEYKRPFDHKTSRDTKFGYIWNRCCFLVNSKFSFGQRTVDKGTCHLIQTTEVAMLLFELPPDNVRARRFEKCFQPHEQMLYTKYVLEPYSSYKIPPGTVYVLVAVQKSMFAVRVIYENTLVRIPCKDFRGVRKLDTFSFEPQTPAFFKTNHDDGFKVPQLMEDEQNNVPNNVPQQNMMDDDMDAQQSNVPTEQNMDAQQSNVPTEQNMDAQQSNVPAVQNMDAQQNPAEQNAQPGQQNNMIDFSEEMQFNMMMDSFILQQPQQQYYLYQPVEPIAREVNIVTPDFIKYYKQTKQQMLEDPKLTGIKDYETTPLDLSIKKKFNNDDETSEATELLERMINNPDENPTTDDGFYVNLL